MRQATLSVRSFNWRPRGGWIGSPHQSPQFYVLTIRRMAQVVYAGYGR